MDPTDLQPPHPEGPPGLLALTPAAPPPPPPPPPPPDPVAAGAAVEFASLASLPDPEVVVVRWRQAQGRPREGRR